MIKKIFNEKLAKKYKISVFKLNKDNFKKIKCNLNIDYRKLDKNNIEFYSHLIQIPKDVIYGCKKGIDEGIVALYQDKVVGYGFIKNKKSNDYFFKISKSVTYLCRFFVVEEYRGRSIFPSIMSKMIDMIPSQNDIYVAAEINNNSSKNGILKVGFEKQFDMLFIRLFKITFFKKKLE